MADQRLLLTDPLLARSVTKSERIFDTKCTAFYADKVPGRPAALYVKPYCRVSKKQVRVPLGTHDLGADEPAQRFDVAKARAKAEDWMIRARNGDDILAAIQVTKIVRAETGMLVETLVDQFVEHLKEPIAKTGYDHKVPRKDTWANDEGILRRFIKPAFGHRVASTITTKELKDQLRAIAKKSNSNGRMFKTITNKLFEFAVVELDVLTANPAANLPKLDKAKVKTRVLTDAEIAIFWHGLDDPDCPGTRATKRALKAILCSMLRPVEITQAMRCELRSTSANLPYIHIPFHRVKKRRDILQPLNSLMIELVAGNTDAIFDGVDFDIPIERHSLSQVLRGRKGKSPRMGICEYLGLKPFTPHDLRRTAATLAGNVGQPQPNISLCLDHQQRTEEGQVVPTVTGKVYELSHRLPEKRQVMIALDRALREIINDKALRKAA